MALCTAMRHLQTSVTMLHRMEVMAHGGARWVCTVHIPSGSFGKSGITHREALAHGGAEGLDAQVHVGGGHVGGSVVSREGEASGRPQRVQHAGCGIEVGLHAAVGERKNDLPESIERQGADRLKE